MTATGTSMTTPTRAARAAHGDQLATAVSERRVQLSLSMAAAEAAGGPSHPTLVRIESGQSPPLRPITLAKLDRALRWRPGTAARVYAGDTAALADADRDEPAALTVGVSIDETARLLQAAADVAAAPDFPPVLAQGFRHAAADLVGDVLPRLAACDNPGDVSALTQAIQRLIVESPNPGRHNAEPAMQETPWDAFPISGPPCALLARGCGGSRSASSSWPSSWSPAPPAQGSGPGFRVVTAQTCASLSATGKSSATVRDRDGERPGHEPGASCAARPPSDVQDEDAYARSCLA